MVLKDDTINQTMLVPMDLSNLIPEGHPCYFIKNVVDQIDCSEAFVRQGSTAVSYFIAVIPWSCQLIPGVSVGRYLNGSGLRIAVKSISVDYKVYTVGVFIIVLNRIAKFELNKSSQGSKGSTASPSCYKFGYGSRSGTIKTVTPAESALRAPCKLT